MSFTPALFLAAGAMQATGSLVSGAAQSSAAKFNQQIASQNAEIARQQTDADILRLRKSASRQLGGIRAAVGASGIQLDGSALDVLENSAMEAEMDVQRRKYQGDMTVRGYRNDANLYRLQGRAARIGSYFGAASDIMLGGAQYGLATGPKMG